MAQASLMNQFLPQYEDQRLRMLDLPPAGGTPADYGYSPNSMNLQAPEGGIVDPTYLAQLAILNQGGMNQPMGMQPMGLLGSGLGPQERGPVTPFLTIPNYRPMAQAFRNEKAAAAAAAAAAAGGGGDSGDGVDSGGGGFSGRGVGADNLAFGILGATEGPLGKLSPVGALANYGAGQYLDARTDYIGNQDFGLLNNVPGGMGTFADQYGNVGTYSSPSTIAAQDAAYFGDIGGGGGGGNDYSGSGETGMGVNSAGQSFSDSASIAAQDASMFGGDSDGGGGGGGDGGGKIICTAMNQAYGFGSFRNAIWIAYADKHLTKAHEVGYHTLFLPLVDFGFKRGNGKANVAVRKVMEWGTRHRSTDLRAEMRGTKRDTTGRVIRMIFEPLCYAVGKLKGN